MIKMTRNEAQVLLGAVRVLAHLKNQSPSPGQVAGLLEMPETSVRLQLVHLRDLGAVDLVESAFDTHVEILDHLLIEDLPEEEGPAITEDLKDFDRRKREEADRMAQLFDSGEQAKKQQDKLDRMDEELKDFKKKKKPANPFGDG